MYGIDDTLMFVQHTTLPRLAKILNLAVPDKKGYNHYNGSIVYRGW